MAQRSQFWSTTTGGGARVEKHRRFSAPQSTSRSKRLRIEGLSVNGFIHFAAACARSTWSSLSIPSSTTSRIRRCSQCTSGHVQWQIGFLQDPRMSVHVPMHVQCSRAAPVSRSILNRRKPFSPLGASQMFLFDVLSQCGSNVLSEWLWSSKYALVCLTLPHLLPLSPPKSNCIL